MGGLKTPTGIHAVERTDLSGQVAVGTADTKSVAVKDIGIGGYIVIVGTVVIALGHDESAGLVVNAHALGAFAQVVLPVVSLDDVGANGDGLEGSAGADDSAGSL